MLFLTILSLFSIFISKILTQNQNIVYTCQTTNNKKVKRLDNVYLCIHLQPMQVKVGFNVKVDQASVVRVEDIFSNLKDKNTQINVMAQMQFNELYSMQAPYYNNGENWVFPVMNLMIQLDQGKVSNYFWRNTCLGCSGNDVVNTCETKSLTSTIINPADTSSTTTATYNQENCKRTKCSADFKDCDLRIYVTWSGLDSEGKNLLSSA